MYFTDGRYDLFGDYISASYALFSELFILLPNNSSPTKPGTGLQIICSRIPSDSSTKQGTDSGTICSRLTNESCPTELATDRQTFFFASRMIHITDLRTTCFRLPSNLSRRMLF